MTWFQTRRRLIAVLSVAVVVFVLGALVLRRGGAGGGEIETDVAVHVGQIEVDTLQLYVTAYGYVEPAPASKDRPPASALLSPIVGGVVAEIDCVEGARVEQGDVLFRLDSRLAEVAVERARQEKDVAERAFQRQQELLPSQGTSQRAYDEARGRLDAATNDLASAETQLSYLRLTTPLSGTVVHLNAAVGQHVDPGTVLAEIVNLNRLVVSAEVPAREAAGLRVGQPVLVGADSTDPTGRLTIVGRDVDPSSGTYRVQASVPSGAGFMPGQFTAIRIVTEVHEGVLVIPEVGLVTRAGEGTWIVVVEGDRAVRRPVTVGLRDRGLVEVSGDGLEAGVTIVTDDAYSLPEETKIHIVAQ
jgi:membrane fusion protein, multidrug efflux system